MSAASGGEQGSGLGPGDVMAREPSVLQPGGLLQPDAGSGISKSSSALCGGGRNFHPAPRGWDKAALLPSQEPGAGSLSPTSSSAGLRTSGAPKRGRAGEPGPPPPRRRIVELACRQPG